MPGTQVIQQRLTQVVSGVTQYSIVTTCTVPGTLQDTGIFLLDIITPADPKDDVLKRVIGVADVSVYGTNRDTEVALNSGSWRSSSFTLTYTDITVANSAKDDLNARITALVNKYDEYLQEFATNDGGVVISFPTADLSIQTELKNAYYEANENVTTAQEALTAHTTECAGEKTELDSTETQLQQAQADLVLATSIQAVVTATYAVDSSVYTTLNTNNTQLRTLNQTSSATDPEKDNINAVLNSNGAALTSFNTQNGALSTLLGGAIATQVSTLQARVGSLIQAKNTLLVQLNKCHTTASELEAALTAAIAAREAALAAVVAVCPDFVP